MHRLSSTLLILILLSFSAEALAQYLPEPELGPKKVIKVPTKPNYAYQKGKKVELIQDLTFIAMSYREPYPTKEFRHKYYKDKIYLVISELKEASLLKEGFYALRLTPGGTERKLNVLAEYMKHDEELDYVSRVFKDIKFGVKELLVPVDKVLVKTREAVDIKEIKKHYYSFPVKFHALGDEPNTYQFMITDRKADTVVLANQMQESGYYVWVEPVFIRLSGKKVNAETQQRIKYDMENVVTPEEKVKFMKTMEERQELLEKARNSKINKIKNAIPGSDEPKGK